MCIVLSELQTCFQVVSYIIPLFASVKVSSAQEFDTETWGWCSYWEAGAWEILNFSITPIIMTMLHIISVCASTQKVMMKMKFL